MAISKVSNADSDTLADDCQCGNYDSGANCIQCLCCKRWWHYDCVGLKGLTEPNVKKMKSWRCPFCYVLPVAAKRKISKENGTNTDTVGTDLVSSRDVSMIVKTEIMELLPAIVDKVVKQNTETVDTKWSTVLKKNMVTQKEEFETAVSTVVKQNQQELVTKALDETKLKQTSDYLDRERRKRNVVIKNIPESKKVTSADKTEEDFEKVSLILDLDDDNISKVIRAGPELGKGINKNRTSPRPVIVTLSTPQLAEQVSNYGVGFKVRLEKMEAIEGLTEFWVNPDRIQSDRLADYKARVKSREEAAKRRRKDDGTVPTDVIEQSRAAGTVQDDVTDESRDTNDVPDESRDTSESFR